MPDPRDNLPRLDELLTRRFGFTAFRPGQREAIETLLTHRHVLCIQPTGHGKSLIYQIPAVLLPGLTVVISPLLALVRDQVHQLTHRFDVPAASINSDQTDEENERAMTAARTGALRVLFVSPERLDHVAHYRFLLTLPVDLVVVDEAHCISTWGHDFRPSYRRIVEAVRAFEVSARNRGVALHVLGLTATADRRTELDIAAQLGGDSPPRVLREGMDRPNLALATTRVHGPADKLARLDALLHRTEGCGLLYCATRDQTGRVAAWLAHRGHAVVAYHAGIDPERKRALQADFLAGTFKAIAATNALGMGIDKADLRFVVHVDVPGSITACYQEVGRAGRDGLPARGVLLFDPADRRIQAHFIRSSQPGPEDFGAVRAAIRPDETGAWPTQTAIRIRCGLHPTRVTVVLAELREQGLIEKTLARGRQIYRRTGCTTTPDLDRYSRQREVRERELAAMMRYGAGEVGCLMASLREALGDVEPEACGRCAHCAPEAWTDLVPGDEGAEARAAAQDWLDSQPIELRGSRRPLMSPGLAAFDSEGRNPAFIHFMRARAAPDPMQPDALDRLLRAARRLATRHDVAGVIAVPSRSWAQRDAVADAVAAALGVPRITALSWARMPAQRQGALLNTEQRRQNVAGCFTVTAEARLAGDALILLDDYTGSGATMKAAVDALRREGGYEGELVPLAVARVRWRLGAPGIV